ncbi:hypothetical protein [Streptomyces variegatus]|uniref:hypothetical protein n=1 Tax=Streptomyces variegatus TaxID=284040 RepID=UPI003C302DF5
MSTSRTVHVRIGTHRTAFHPSAACPALNGKPETYDGQETMTEEQALALGLVECRVCPAEDTAPATSYRGVPAPEWLGGDWDTVSAGAWRDGVDAALTYVAVGGTPEPEAAEEPEAEPDLWQNLADALNALGAAGQFPAFHDLYGTVNGWRRQPYASTARADSPWVVLDLGTRQYTVSTRGRVLSGEHSPDRKRRR